MWARVKATVRPLKRDQPTPAKRPSPDPLPVTPPKLSAPAKPAGRVPPMRMPVEPRPSATVGANTLDSGWDRRIGRGQLIPDSTVDLHGYTLEAAHRALDDGLGRAIMRGDRVLLLITGKPPRAGVERPYARGAIRAAVNDWLAISPYSRHIAAVRGAHPRHGGHGALYIILRRNRL